MALSEKGIHVPSQTFKIRDKLFKLIELYKPTSLLFVGDVKHTITTVVLQEWRDIPELFEGLIARVKDIRIVLGNHDGNLEPLLPPSVKIYPPTGLALWDVGFFHGNAWPTPELLQCRSLVIGHVHPTVTFRDPLGFRIIAQVWLRASVNKKQLARAFLKGLGVKVKTGNDPVKSLQERFKMKLKSSEFIIMPYFNDFLGGRPINRGSSGGGPKSFEYLGPLLRSGSVDVENAETYLLDGTYLGTVSQLRALS